MTLFYQLEVASKKSNKDNLLVIDFKKLLETLINKKKWL